HYGIEPSPELRQWALGVRERDTTRQLLEVEENLDRVEELRVAPATRSTLDELAAGIRENHEAALLHATQGLEHARRAGELLIEARELVEQLLGPGHWLAWVRTNTHLSDRVSQQYQ